MKLNKKGNFRDVPEWISFAIVFSFLVVMASLMIGKINDNVQSTSNSTIPTEAKTGVANLDTAFNKYYDLAIALMYVVFFVFSVVMARLIPSTPKFIFIGIIYLIGLPFASLYVMNVWDGFSSNATISAVLSDLKFVPFFMDYLIFFVLFYIGGVAIALYTKEN